MKCAAVVLTERIVYAPENAATNATGGRKDQEKFGDYLFVKFQTYPLIRLMGI